MKVSRKIVQKFHHYELWEDWKAGQYSRSERDEESLILLAQNILSVSSECEAAMKRAVFEWPISTEVNLTNLGTNRRAWLGQAACCISHSVPDYLTKLAWWRLDEKTQDAANKIAEDIIVIWENWYLEKYDAEDIYGQRRLF